MLCSKYYRASVVHPDTVIQTVLLFTGTPDDHVQKQSELLLDNPKAPGKAGRFDMKES